MNKARYQRINDLFHDVVGLSPIERATQLERACGEDHTLKDAVKRMVAADQRSDRFMEPVDSQDTSPIADDSCKAGTRIGPYRVLRQIGAGGMGNVYLAERADQQFQRSVAIKVLKRGMDTDELLRRFQLEREVLASLDHEGIARLLDAGSLDDGRPFLVMEYVHGRPIDRDCDARRLTIDQRLDVFLSVLDAVDHAHQRMVIHRDLKPANILVEESGDPRLLDFGVAKLTASDQPAVTVTGGLLPMTPEYASPEQRLGRPVSTATDVYSLGVVLHELLAGVRPIASELDEFANSSEAASTGETASSRAEARNTTTRALARRISSDLDNIVQMALHNDPAQRYPSVQQFSADLRRHRDGFPVVARPPTLGYRFARFSRRNRLLVTGLASLFLSLLSGLAGLGWMANESEKARGLAERERTRSEAVLGFLQETLESARPDRGGREVTVAEALTRAATQVADRFGDDRELREEVQLSIGKTLLSLGHLDEAVEQLRAVLASREARLPADDPRVGEALTAAGVALYSADQWDGAQALLERALTINRGRADPQEIAQAQSNLAVVFSARGEPEIARALYAEAMGLLRQLGPEARLQLAETLNNLSNTHRLLGEPEDALAVMREAHGIRSGALDEDHPLLIQSASNYAVLLMSAGELDEAEPLLRAAIEKNKEVLGPDHIELATDYSSLASLHQIRGETDQAVSLLRECVRIRRSELPPESLRLANTIFRLGALLGERGDPAGLALLRECRAPLATGLGAEHAKVRQVDDTLSRLEDLQ